MEAGVNALDPESKIQEGGMKLNAEEDACHAVLLVDALGCAEGARPLSLQNDDILVSTHCEPTLHLLSLPADALQIVLDCISSLPVVSVIAAASSCHAWRTALSAAVHRLRANWERECEMRESLRLLMLLNEHEH